MTTATTNSTTEDAWLKHLEFIQNVVTRMARNSFFLKGWSVTLVSATFALSLSIPSIWIVLVALLPALAFSVLDAYYLRQERLFRKLYDDVRQRPREIDAFSMNTSPYNESVDGVSRILLTVSVLPFHGPIVAVILLAALLRLIIF